MINDLNEGKILSNIIYKDIEDIHPFNTRETIFFYECGENNSFKSIYLTIDFLETKNYEVLANAILTFFTKDKTNINKNAYYLHIIDSEKNIMYILEISLLIIYKVDKMLQTLIRDIKNTFIKNKAIPNILQELNLDETAKYIIRRSVKTTFKTIKLKNVDKKETIAPDIYKHSIFKRFN